MIPLLPETFSLVVAWLSLTINGPVKQRQTKKTNGLARIWQVPVDFELQAALKM